MTRRLYLAPSSQSLQAQGELTLSRDQSHYLRSVLRLRSGNALEVFNGQGAVAQAQLLEVDSRTTQLQLGSVTQVPAAPHRLYCACAVLKNQAMDRVIQKATELGATDIQPLYTEHTQIPNKARNSEVRQQHWQRIIESTTEQCGQNHLPELHSPVNLSGYVEALPAAQAIVLALGGGRFPSELPAADTLLLSGPEGGWSDVEITLMRTAGIQPAQIGQLVLRAETAPLAGLVSVQMAWTHAQDLARPSLNQI